MKSLLLIALCVLMTGCMKSKKDESKPATEIPVSAAAPAQEAGSSVAMLLRPA